VRREKDDQAPRRLGKLGAFSAASDIFWDGKKKENEGGELYPRTKGQRTIEEKTDTPKGGEDA